MYLKYLADLCLFALESRVRVFPEEMETRSLLPPPKKFPLKSLSALSRVFRNAPFHPFPLPTSYILEQSRD